MKNWKLTLGNSLQAFGTALVGVGVAPQLTGTPSKALTFVAVAGFLANAFGIFFNHLFVADQTAAIKDIRTQQVENTQNIQELKTP